LAVLPQAKAKGRYHISSTSLSPPLEAALSNSELCFLRVVYDQLTPKETYTTSSVRKFSF